MTAWPWVLGAAAVVCLPAPGRTRPRLRLSSVLPGAADHRAVRVVRALGRAAGSAGHGRCVGAAGTATAVTLCGLVPLVPSLCVAAVVALVAHVAWRAWERHAGGRVEDTAARVVVALADELRAGRSPPQALAVVAESGGPLAGSLAVAARATGLGGDTEVALRDVAAAAPAGAELHRLAAAWQLSRTSGCSLADVLDAVAGDARDRRQRRRLVAGLLSGPRATAGLLAALPVLGVLMGSALGADPVRVLTSTGPGQLALAAGVGLDIAGVLWTERLVRGAEPAWLRRP